MWLCFWLSITLTFLCYALILPSPLSNAEFSLLYLELSPLHTACCQCDKRQSHSVKSLILAPYLLHHHPSKPEVPVKHQKPEICLFTWVQLSQIYVTSLSATSFSCPKSPPASHSSHTAAQMGNTGLGVGMWLKILTRGHICFWITAKTGFCL